MKIILGLTDTDERSKEVHLTRDPFEPVLHNTIYDDLSQDFPTEQAEFDVLDGGSQVAVVELTGDQWRHLEDTAGLDEMFLEVEQDPSRAKEIILHHAGVRPITLTYTYMEQRTRYFGTVEKAQAWIEDASADGEIASGQDSIAGWYSIDPPFYDRADNVPRSAQFRRIAQTNSYDMVADTTPWAYGAGIVHLPSFCEDANLTDTVFTNWEHCCWEMNLSDEAVENGDGEVDVVEA